MNAKEMLKLSHSIKYDFSQEDLFVDALLKECEKQAKNGFTKAMLKSANDLKFRYVAERLRYLGYKVRIGFYDNGKRGSVMDPSERGTPVYVRWGMWFEE